MRQTLVLRARILRVLVCVTALMGSAGCVTTTFVPTDSSYRPHHVEQIPEVYIDRLPELPYRSVGIIEVKTADTLDAIIEAAKQKGKEIGCDLVVAKSLHRVGRNAAQPTIGPALAQAPLRRRSTCASSPPPPHAAEVAFPALCAQYSPPPPTQPPPEPTVRREFICGIYKDIVAPSSGRARRPQQQDVWESLVGTQPIGKACQNIRRVLEMDKDCQGEQCRAAVGLARLYMTRCSDHDEAIHEVRQWKRTWYTQAPKAAGDECSRYLMTCIRSASAARDYRLQCLADREAGFVEGLILNRAIGRGGEQEAQDAEPAGADPAEGSDVAEP